MAEVSVAELDSLTAAFYLLKFEHDLLEATHAATVRADSLQLASVVRSYESLMDYERSKRRRDIITIGVTAVITGTVFYFARTVD